ncbi:Rieske (2Fe-2S) protein [Streptomyces wuyuanensis]|uniref:Cytochrome bc1 complex Rieske iron-sulfur subunit n=1 Tax=Streptomyces wuyuanensis TaxID=1196353 RepID=A0A1G9T321_9ACTN|nr:Rieske (2Fe-2S) protein [Streptomyces wuyuanensis]SDM42123.1 Ferredoxin subunit of nitrite reductase or a ring-hydroxylating dioxygenase [Streptomyces wuyuanensis]
MTGTQGPARAVARRTVFTAAGGAGLAAALTACGGSESSGSGTVTPADGGSTGGSTGGTTGGTTGGSGGKVIASIADIPEGGGKVIGDIVVTQPTAGEFKAFSSKCTHQGCAVKSVADGIINCPCHNSNFDAGDGSVKSGPATTPLPAAAIVVEGGSIKLA